MNWAGQLHVVVIELNQCTLDISAPKGASLSASLSPLFKASFVDGYMSDARRGAQAPDLASFQGKVRERRPGRNRIFRCVLKNNGRQGRHKEWPSKYGIFVGETA